MVKDDTEPGGRVRGDRPVVKTGTCDWCYEACPVHELTPFSGARLCQGCAPFYYLGDEDGDDEDDEQ